MTTTLNQHSLTRALRRCFGKFHHVKKIHTRMDELMATDFSAEEPENLFIIGDTGTGKSTLLKRYCKDHPRIVHMELTEVPVLYVEVPSRCTVKMLAGFLLQALGSPFWNCGDEVERTFQLVTLLNACKVRLVILDEINHLVDRGKEKSHYAVGDWIKQLITSSNVPFVLSGIQRSRTLLNTNEQLADRFGEVICVETFTAETGKDNSIGSAVYVYGAALGKFPSVDLMAEINLQKFAFATAGRLRGLRRLFVRAVEISFTKKNPQIDLQTLAQAFEEVIFAGAPSNRNPFKREFDGHPLIRDGEPYANYCGGRDEKK